MITRRMALNLDADLYGLVKKSPKLSSVVVPFPEYYCNVVLCKVQVLQPSSS